MGERNEMLGRLAANNELIQTLETGIDVDRSEARSILDPFGDCVDINVARLKVVTDRIVESVTNLKKLVEQTRKIKKELGL